MKHKHHIIPKHAGGTDDPSNLVELSVFEHAEAHRILYETYGLEEDLIAWRGLSGIVTREVVVREAQSLGGKKSIANGNPWSGKRTKMNFAENKELQVKASEASKTPEAVAKRKETCREGGLFKEEKNSQYGRIWISNPLTKEFTRLERGEQIPDGWVRGMKGHVPKKLWINNGIKEHYVLFENEQEYIVKGFSRGRLKRSLPQNKIR
jgi:hypothetical protein